MNISKSYNYTELDALTTSSGTLINISLQSLSDAKYDLVINLLPDDNEHAIAGEEEAFAQLAIDYVYIPVDWDKPTTADFEAFETTMKQNNGKKIHIHCAANYRASAFYALYAAKHKGWSTDQQNELISSIWHLDDYPIWLSFYRKHNH